MSGAISGLRALAVIATIGASMWCASAASSATVTFQEIQAIEAQYNQLYSAGRFREAVPVAEQLAESVKKFFGTKHQN